MSIKIVKNTLNRQELLTIRNECYILGIKTEYGPQPEILAYVETKNNIYIPFFYGINKFNIKYDIKQSDNKFIGPDFNTIQQKNVYESSVDILNKYNCVFLSLYCGFGKTYLAIRLSCLYNLKTAILIPNENMSFLSKQWIESLNKYIENVQIQIVPTSGQLDPSAQYYIFNMSYVSKIKKNGKWTNKQIGIFKDIDLLIIDEAHLICAQESSKSLFYFTPKLCIVLTATPYRDDGLDKLLNLYFGDDDKTKIILKSSVPFIVYRLFSNITPECKYTMYRQQSRLDWNSVIDYLSFNSERNKMIVSIVNFFPNKVILILTKLKNHRDLLAELLKSKSIVVIKQGESTYDKTASILISTYKKLGTGFDDPRIEVFIVAIGVKNIEQKSGRLREKDQYNQLKERYIVDIVDKHSCCNNHWLIRRKHYLDINGIIKSMYYDNNAITLTRPKNNDKNTGNKRLAKI